MKYAGRNNSLKTPLEIKTLSSPIKIIMIIIIVISRTIFKSMNCSPADMFESGDEDVPPDTGQRVPPLTLMQRPDTWEVVGQGAPPLMDSDEELELEDDDRPGVAGRPTAVNGETAGAMRDEDMEELPLTVEQVLSK